MASNKQGTVTEEHREEARKLRAIWDRRLPELKLRGLGTQEAFGAEFEIGNQAAVGFFLNGKTALSLKAAVRFAKGLDCNVADFSPRLAALLPRHDQWPFRLVTPDLWASLSEWERGVAEEALRVMVARLKAGAPPEPAAPGFSALALDLAKQLDAIPPASKQRAHAAASGALSRVEAEVLHLSPKSQPDPPIAPSPEPRPRKTR